MRVCRHAGCSDRVGREFYFCPGHRGTEYAETFRLLKGANQP